MGVFGAVFGRRGDVGFSGALLGVSSGVVGFNLAMFLCPVREFFTPRRCGRRVGVKKFASQAQNGQNMLFSGALGECFRGNAAGGPCWASYFACQQSWDPGRVLMQRGPGRWALVAVLTLQCAAEAT